MAKTFEHKPNSGSLFQVAEKRSENGPDYTGRIKVGDTLMEIAAWTKQSVKGNWLSLKVQPLRERQQPQQQPGGSVGQPFDDEIPFAPDR